MFLTSARPFSILSPWPEQAFAEAAMSEELTDRQREILTFIQRHIDDNGYPPTVREIGSAFGIRSTNGVADHLKSLERKGFLARGSLKSRALRPIVQEEADPTFNDAPVVRREGASVTSLAAHRARVGVPPAALEPVEGGRMVTVPVLGAVAAGAPILAEENAEDSVQVDSFLLGGHRKVFALRVKGDSMIGDGIFDGDYIFVKKQLHADDGQIVVAMVENEATVKRIYREGDRVRLQPSNPRLQPIYVRREDFRETQVLGVVIGVYRKMP
jgi:repressor LexA